MVTPADLTKGKGTTYETTEWPLEKELLISLFDYLLFPPVALVCFSWFPQNCWDGDM